jgi:hypothetical protein
MPAKRRDPKPLALRRDDAYRRRCRLAIAAIGLAMPFVLAAWALIPIGAPFGLRLLPMLLWLAYAAVLSELIFRRPLKSYHCPQCGRALSPSEAARPWIRFPCRDCGVEWDVNRTDAGNGGE